jgi:hypothetical protein
MLRRGWLTAGIAAAVLAIGTTCALGDEEQASDGEMHATLSWEQTGDEAWRDLWLTVDRAGVSIHDEPIDIPNCEEPACGPLSVAFTFRKRKSLHVRDLDGDGEPEVVVGVRTSTGHCCTVAQVLRWDGAAYRPVSHSFAIPGFELVDLDHDGRAEFRSADGRFAYAFTSFAGSWMPPQVWTFDSSGFRDVTRSYPRLARADARRTMRVYQHSLHDRYPGQSASGALAAWVADQRLVGHALHARNFLEREQRAGRLDALEDYSSSTAYLHDLQRKLHRWGY